MTRRAHVTAGLVAVGLVLSASPALADVRVDTSCSELLDAARLRESIRLEVGSEPAVIVGPCADGRVVFEIGGQRGELDLLGSEFERALALVIGERAVSPRPTVPAMAPIAAAAEPTPLPPRDGEPTPTTTGPPAAELGVALMHRLYMHKDQTATGVRASLSWPLPIARAPFLRMRLDAGGDHVVTPYSFDLLAGRVGAAVLARKDLSPRVAAEAGVRTELLVARLRRDEMITIDREWTAAWTAGVVAGTSLGLGAGVRLRVELAGELVVAARDVVRTYVEFPDAPAYPMDPVTASAVLTVGLDVGVLSATRSR